MKRNSLIIALVVVICLTLTGCGSKQTENETKKVTKMISAENYGLKVEGTFPAVEEKNDEGKVEVVSDYELSKPGKKGNDDFSFANDKYEFGFHITSYVYNSYKEYKDKYKAKEVNFENYLEFLEDSDFDSLKASQKDYELTEVAGIRAVKYEYSNRMIYVLDLEGSKASKQMCTLTVYTLDSDKKIADVINEKEVKDILNSFVISGK